MERYLEDKQHQMRPHDKGYTQSDTEEFEQWNGSVMKLATAEETRC